MKSMIQRPAFRSLEPFTQAEFARWLEELPPDDLFHYELLDGFIVREPPAGWPHGHVAMEIGSRLAPFVRKRKLGLVFDSSQGFDLATGDTVEPDVSFVSATRWNTLPRPIRGFLKVAPELVFEILSPSTSRIDKKQKKRIYERNEILEYVLVDAATETFEIFHLAAGAYGAGLSLSAGDTFASRVLPGVEIPVAEVFFDE
jgi:Uma2 family endonuclease